MLSFSQDKKIISYLFPWSFQIFCNIRKFGIAYVGSNFVTLNGLHFCFPSIKLVFVQICPCVREKLDFFDLMEKSIPEDQHLWILVDCFGFLGLVTSFTRSCIRLICLRVRFSESENGLHYSTVCFAKEGKNSFFVAYPQMDGQTRSPSRMSRS